MLQCRHTQRAALAKFAVGKNAGKISGEKPGSRAVSEGFESLLLRQ